MKDKPVQYWLESPEESEGFLFWQITNLWSRKMNNALNEVDLTHVQFALLSGVAWLERFDEEISQVKLSKHAKTNIMMTSKVIRTLESKGLIWRKACKSDTRAKCLYLTDEGRQRIIKAIAIVQSVHEEFFKGMDNNSEFIKNLNQILQSNSGEW